jgi:hypothetical protein
LCVHSGILYVLSQRRQAQLDFKNYFSRRGAKFIRFKIFFSRKGAKDAKVFYWFDVSFIVRGH